MTETQTGKAEGQSVNGKAPAGVPPEPEADTGEKWLGILMLAAAAFLAFVAIDRLSGGRLTTWPDRGDDASG